MAIRNRPYGGVTKTYEFAPHQDPPKLIPIVIARVNLGMITTTDKTDIDPSALSNAKNARVRFDKTTRRPDTIPYGDTPPDSNPILGLYSYKDYLNTGFVFRFTRDSIYYNPDAWTPIVGTLSGDDTDRFTIATAFNKIVFSNNGVDQIQVIDQTTDTFARLGNAPRYKYVTVFANRVIGVNRTDSGVESPIEVGWSGDANPTEWNPLVDPSAGSSPVIESPGDNSDFMTGCFGFTNVLVILKQRSILVGTKNPIAENPFSFYTDVPGIGCNCPYSAVVIPGGLVFADARTGKVYVYTVGQQPTAISMQIENRLFTSLGNPDLVQGSYDNKNNEYHLSIPLVGSNIIRTWVFNFRTQAWTYDERVDLTLVADIEGTTVGLTIDDLTGTIDDLMGTIDDLVYPTSTVFTSRLYGFADGTIELEVPGVSDTEYITELTSKTFNLDYTDQYICSIQHEFYCYSDAVIVLSYSKDGGVTWVGAKTYTITELNVPFLVQYNRQIKCRKITWKLESLIGDWELLYYELLVYRSGPSKGTGSPT